MSAECFFTQRDYTSVNSGLEVEEFSFHENELFFTLKDRVAYCPFQSSFSLFSKALNPNTIRAFINSLENKVNSIQFVLPPLVYEHSQNHLSELLNHEFKIKRVELVQYIDLLGSFRSKLNSRYKNLLNRVHRLKAKTCILTVKELGECYRLLKENRDLKGYKMTMSEEKVRSLMHAFPSSFLLYGTYIQGELVACSITIKVSSEVLYQFAWAHKASYNKLSPLIFHNEQIFNQAKSDGVLRMDLGSCSDDGVINKGVYRFKKYLGAGLSKKYYLEYKF